MLELGADHRFHVENYIESRDGEWTLADDELILGDLHTRIESVDDSRLVLLEDLPKAYLRDGPPRKVRNTYGRVSESELGPMLGTKVVTTAPRAGAYASAYSYSMNKLPTMEIGIGKSVRGNAELELAADGTMTGCFGIHTGSSFSESKHSSDDGQHHSRSDEHRWLLGVRGTWTPAASSARVRATEFWPDSCAREGEAQVMGPIELECVALAANDRLPANALACRIVTGPSSLEEIALNPADTERAGPYTLQLEPMGHVFPDTGRPWLILGERPGLRVESKDDRDAKQPVVRFVAAKVELVELNYVNEPL